MVDSDRIRILGQFGDDYLVGSDDSSDLIDGGEGQDRIEGSPGTMFFVEVRATTS